MYAQFLAWSNQFVKVWIPEQEPHGSATVLSNKEVFLAQKPTEGVKELVIFVVKTMKVDGMVGKTLVVQLGVDAEFFAQPQPLPALRGVRAFPQSQEHEEGMLLLEFGVTSRGRVVDLERLDDNPANDAKASNIMRRVRQTVFRPRISDGLPVDTAGVVVAYDISQW